jgi:hypothetical protein
MGANLSATGPGLKNPGAFVTGTFTTSPSFTASP